MANTATQKSNREHSFDIELATILGIPKAVLLKNIAFWVTEHTLKGDNKIGSKCYHKESYKRLARKHPYLPKGNFSRWFDELKSDGWILLIKGENGENLISTGPVFDAWNDGFDWELVQQEFQNETARGFKMKQGGVQNETTGGVQNETTVNTDFNTDLSLIQIDAGAKSAPLHPQTESDFAASTQPGEAEKKAPPLSAPPPPQKPAKKTKRDCPFDLTATVAELPRTLNAFFAELVHSGHWGAWIEYRLALRPVYPYATERGFKTQLQELSNKSHGSADTAKQIIDQSIGRRWTGFVALRAEQNFAPRKTHVDHQHEVMRNAFTTPIQYGD